MKVLYILSGLGVITLLAEFFRYKRYLLFVTLVGLFACLMFIYIDRNETLHPMFHNMLKFDRYALLFMATILGIAFLWFIMAGDFLNDQLNITDKYALIIFSLIGAMLLVSYNNMVMLFLGIEILSIPMYVLAGSRKDDMSSNESALKYFLMGAFASGFLLFGIVLLYGVFGTFDLQQIQIRKQGVPLFNHSAILLSGGILFMLIGLAFKVSAVPFHFWAPDVYTGAPSQVTAFMATVVKTAAFAALLRFFITCFSGMEHVWENVIWLMAAFTILLGNITAVYQNNLKRMLAYSSISHAGYMMVAVLAMNESSSGAVLYYAIAYSVSTVGMFSALTILESQTINHKPQTITFETVLGLSKQNPLLALAICVTMLSLSGIPPLAGFFGKYYIFTAALEGGFVWLVIIAVLGSLIGVYYYFKVIINVYKPGVQVTLNGMEISFLQKIFFGAIILLSVLLGIFPDVVIRLF